MSQSHSNVLVIDGETPVVEDDGDDVVENKVDSNTYNEFRDKLIFAINVAIDAFTSAKTRNANLDDSKFDLSIADGMAVNAIVNAAMDVRSEDNEVFDEKLVEDEPTEDYTFVNVREISKIAQSFISSKLTKKAAEKLTSIMDGLYKHLAKNITIEDDANSMTASDIENLIDDIFTGNLRIAIVRMYAVILSKYEANYALNKKQKEKGLMCENSLAKIVCLRLPTYMSRSYVGYYKYNKSDRRSLRSINTQAILCYTCAVEKTIELLLGECAEYARNRGRKKVSESDIDLVLGCIDELSYVFDSI
jgi:histone H3/H4